MNSSNPTEDKAAAERRSNLLLGFSGALRNSAIGPGIDTQKVVANLGTLLARPGKDGVVALAPLHDYLVREAKLDPLDAAGVLLFIKGGEARYGVTTELPAAVVNLKDEDRSKAVARFSARRAGAADTSASSKRPGGVSDTSGSFKENSGSFKRETSGSSKRPGGVSDTSGSFKENSGSFTRETSGSFKRENSGSLKRPGSETTGSHKVPAAAAAIEVQPAKAAAMFGAVFVLLFVAAVPAGLGAAEAGWGVGAMWVLRHAVLVAGGVGFLALVSPGVGGGLRAITAGGPDVASALALVGGVVLGLLSQVVSPSAEPDASFVLLLVLLAGIAHAAIERFFFHVVQQGLGRDTPPALLGSIVMQSLYVFTYAIVVKGSGGEMMTWVAYALITSAGPAAFLARSGSFWRPFAWQLGFTLANIGVAAS